jgi:hypothetical protein
VNEAGTIGMGERATGRPRPTDESFDSADWVAEITGAAAELVAASPALELANHGPAKRTRHPAINPRIAYSLKRVARILKHPVFRARHATIDFDRARAVGREFAEDQ